MRSIFQTVAKWLLKPVGRVMFYNWTVALVLISLTCSLHLSLMYLAAKHDAPVPPTNSYVADSLLQANTQLMAERELFRAEIQAIQNQKIQNHATLKNIQDSLARRSNADVYANW